MHVVQLLPELQEGGAERVVLDLNRELVRRGVASTVISRGGRLVAQVEADGGRHIRLDVCSKNPLTFPLRALRLRRTLATLSPDLVHVHSRLPAWLLRVANRRLGLPVVAAVHGLNRPGWYSRILTRSARIHCVSQVVRAHLRRHYNTPDSQMRIAYPGVNVERFDPARIDLDFVEYFRRTHRLDGHFIVTSVGRLAPGKDYETFIRGIQAARAQIPNIVGVIVGAGHRRHCRYERRLQNLVRTSGMADAIRFAGQQDQMAEIYAISDAVVSCSAKAESFGRTLAEALAMNTPVVATAHGGALEIVREKIDGFLFAPRDESALARCLETLRQQAPWRDLRAGILQRFALERTMDDILVIYREAQEATAYNSACLPLPLPSGALRPREVTA